MKLQLEYLQSPLPAAKDLFSQLLGSDSKMCSPMSPVQMDFAECISANYCEEDMIKESEQEESDIEDNSEESESR